MRLLRTRRLSRKAGSDVPEHVAELFSRFYEALNDRNLPAIEELLREVEADDGTGLRKVGGFRTSTGRAAIMLELRTWLNSWAAYRAEPTDIASVGDQFVVSTTIVTRPLGSSIDLRGEAADIFVLERGRIESLRLRVNRSAVLRELGLLDVEPGAGRGRRGR
jgi:SnoaL-like domain